MSHQFSLKVDPILGTGHILLNRQPLFFQSQLQICTTQNFLDWYRDLPSLMFAEVNDNYTVSVECLDLQYELLRAVFSTVGECRNLTHVPLKLTYSVEQRFSWLTEVANKLNFTLPEVPKFSVQTAYLPKPDARINAQALPAFYRKYCANNLCQVNIWLTSQNSLGSIPPAQLTNNDIILCEGLKSSPPSLSVVPVFYSEKGKWVSTIITWIDQMILLPYLLYCQESLLKRSKNSSFEVESRIRMIARDEPYVRLNLPSRIETGTFCPIDLKEFPPSSLSLRISDPSRIAQANDRLQAKMPGTAMVAVLSASGQVLQEKRMDVYSVNRVSSISLTCGKGNIILMGDQFSIAADCRPMGAENLSKAVWNVSPASALKNIGGGQFSALAPGNCTITLTIEKVSQSIALTIVPLSTDLQFPAEVRLKLNAAPKNVSAVLLPKGSACKEVRCSIADGRVAQWNGNTKAVVPISEGTTTLEASAIGPAGQILFTKRCPVVILPEKDIITPPTLLTLALCFAFLSLVTWGTTFFSLATLGCVILFAATAVVNLIPWINHCPTTGNKVQTILSIAGAIVSLIVLFTTS